MPSIHTPSSPAPSSSTAPTSPKDGWDFKTGFMVAFVLCMFLNSMPFSDASRFRKAIAACEKNLPRNQECDVQGVVVSPVASVGGTEPAASTKAPR